MHKTNYGISHRRQILVRLCGGLLPVCFLCGMPTVPYFSSPEAIDLIGTPAPSATAPASDRQTDPNSPSAKQVRALIDEERRRAETLIQEFPDRAEPYLLMGKLFRRRGNSAKAVEYWNIALAKNPKLAKVYQELAMLAYETDDYAKAEAMQRKAIEMTPQPMGLRNLLGDALMKQGRYDEAIQVLEEELKIAPTAASTYYGLGRSFLQLQKYDKARECYEKTISLQPNYTNAYYGLSTLCARMKEPETARAYMDLFRKCKERDDAAVASSDRMEYDMTSATVGILEQVQAAAELFVSTGRPDQAESALKRGLELDPQNLNCLERLAMAHQAQGRFQESLMILLKVRELNPNNAQCHLNLGSTYTKLRRFGDAEAAYQKVIELLPKESKGYSELAGLYLRAGRNPSAALGLARAAVGLEANAENYRLLSWALDTNGDRSGAIQAIEQAIRLSPDNQRYPMIRSQLAGRSK